MMKEMYKGIVNSPITSLAEDIGAKDTDIKVVDSSYLPAAPNLAVIGTEGTAETIKYAGINENILTGCTRGFQGTAKAWDKDTLIARNFTEYDLAAVQENITTLDIEKASNQEFTEFKGNIQNQLDEHEAQAEANLKNYAKKTDLSAAETRLDKKIDVKVSNTTFEDFKNTNKIELDKKTNNADLEVYKKEVTSNLAKKVDKVTGKGLSTNDYTDLEKAEVAKIKNKVDKTSITSDLAGTDETKVLSQKAGSLLFQSVNDGKGYIANAIIDLDENKVDRTSITSDLAGTDETKVLSQKGANELNKKFDTIGSSRAATIVIANYDSTEKSKKGADYVVKKGEDASTAIMNAEQELVGFGGKILLMEGKYDCQSAIVLGYAETILEGCNATLVQNENWSETEFGNGETSKHIIANYESMESIIVNNVKIVGQNITDSKGIYCYSTSQVNNCIVSNTGDDGIFCWGSSQVSNCTISGVDGRGIVCDDSSQVSNCTISGTGSGVDGSGIFCSGSSQVSNCTVSDTGSNGIICNESSQVSNCTISGTGDDGIFCWGSSQVSNCTISGVDGRGIVCDDSSQVSNCTISGTSSHGIYCSNPFKGICSFNVLKGCELNDKSSTPSKVEYNIIQ